MSIFTNLQRRRFFLFGKGRRFFVLLPFLVLLTSCVSATGGIATSNVPIQGRNYEVLGPAETTVSWMTFNIGILGFGLSEPPVDMAENRLLERKGGDALINLRYWNDQSVIFFITYQRFHLKADVIRFKKEEPKPAPKNRRRRRR